MEYRIKDPEIRELFERKGIKISYLIADDKVHSASAYDIEIEPVPGYNPDGWNEFPDVIPPVTGYYLIYFKDSSPNPYTIGYWTEKDLGSWKGALVAAFRQIPEYTKDKS